MTDIGSQLRAAREAQGLTLEQAFKATRVKQSFLEAIEANQFQVLPGMVQARGFVRSYANYLGLDGEHLASLLDADKTAKTDIRPMPVTPKPSAAPPAAAARPIVQAPPKPAITTAPKPSLIQSEKPAKAPNSPPALKLPSLALNSSKPAASARPSNGVPTWLLIAGAAVLFLLGLILVISALSTPAGSSAPSESNNVMNTIGAPTADRLESAPAGDGPISITLKSGEHVWARITIDGQTAFEGMLNPGASATWQAAEQIIVETGNGAALSVLHQGQESVLGDRGQIVARAWGHSGAVDVPLAVPEITPTPTAAPAAAAANTVQ